MKSRISNLPFLHKTDSIYESTTKSNFRLAEITANRVIQPKLTHFTQQKTNIKMYDDRCAEFETSSSAFKHLPVTTAKLVRPTTSVKTSWPEGTFPQPIYKSSYTKHEISPCLSSVLRVKELANTGLGSSLRQEKNDQFDSTCHEDFQFPPPLESTEKRVQHSSIPMGDQEKILDRQTMYSTSFRQSAALSPAKVKECLLPDIKKYRPFNLRELCDDEWITTTTEEYCAHKCGPVQLVNINRNLSFVFKREKPEEKLSTTNQLFFPEINRTQLPVYVDGSSIRNLSCVQFGRPDLAKEFFGTTSQEQYLAKEVIRPKPPIYPPSYVLYEQEPDRMLTTVQKDFVTLIARRQGLSPSQLHKVKESHIKPVHGKQDFRTTHKETFMLKPYCKPSQINPNQRHISHIAF
ncbi:uncharacterized protein si:ch211-198o12.4 isoform X2 [Danio aesculapii]|uniref:uncharacterized protein si:ch211-198o12.4 isoform X2 n=1 Tax=Danio aesculapii TaxID=1142201 RepID=UPI0024BFA97A|nr:uncharacterized protein si:ch211-198o12.4 isoform X2 [Danio aesculapii]